MCSRSHDHLCWDYYRVQNYYFTWQFGHRAFHRQQQQHLRSAPEHLDCMPQFCGKRNRNNRSTCLEKWYRTIGLYTYLLDLFPNSTVRRVAVTKMRTVAPITTQVNAILLGRGFWAAIVASSYFWNMIWYENQAFWAQFTVSVVENHCIHVQMHFDHNDKSWPSTLLWEDATDVR